MRDGAYKFCVFSLFLEWSRNFCAVASGMQPKSNSNYKTHLAARQWRSAERGARGKGHREETRAGTVEAITINNQVWEAFAVETRAAA